MRILWLPNDASGQVWSEQCLQNKSIKSSAGDELESRERNPWNSLCVTFTVRHFSMCVRPLWELNTVHFQDKWRTVFVTKQVIIDLLR